MKKTILLITTILGGLIANAQNPYPILPIDSVGFVNLTKLQNTTGNTLPSYVDPTFRDTIYKDTVRFEGIVISNPKAYGLSISRKAAYIQRKGGGPWSGALVMCEPVGTGTTLANLLAETKFYDNFVVGYKVRVTGVIRDFQGETQINLIRSNTNWENGIEQISLTPDTLVYSEITADKLMLGNPNSSARIPQKLTGEQYEGTLVKIKNVTVYSVVNTISGNSNRTAWSVIDDNGNVIEIRDFSSYYRRDALGDSTGLNAVNTTRFIAPAIGTRLDYIQGVVTEYQVSGAARYGIAPIYPGDYKICTSCPPSIRFISKNPSVVKSSDTTKLIFEITVGDTTLQNSKVYFKNSVANNLDSVTLTAVPNYPNYYLAQIPPTNTECIMTYWVSATDKKNRTTLVPDPFSFGNKYYITGANGIENIRTLQTSVVPNGASVWDGDSLLNINVRGIVTGKNFGSLYTIQDGTGPNSAIFATKNSADTIVWNVGDSVLITRATVRESFNVTILNNTLNSVISSGNALPPFQKGLSIDSIALGNINYSRKWEAVLMRFDSIEVTSKNPDEFNNPPGNFGEFAIKRNNSASLRIDDYNTNFKNYNNWVNVGMKMAFIQGPLYFANANFKLIPRDANDGDFSNIDTIKPVLTLIGSAFDTMYQNNIYKDKGATATDNKDGNITNKIVKINNINAAVLGNYSFVYKVSDNAGIIADSLIRMVTVIAKTDSIKPIITLTGAKTISLKKDSAYNELGATALDNVDGNITNKIIIMGNVNHTIVGSYIVSYVVEDMQGNIDSVTRRVNVMLKTDTTKPVITLVGQSNMSIKKDSAYIENGAIAIDDRWGNISNQITISGSVNTSTVGTYTLIYSVCDKDSNCSSITRTVNVILQDLIKPKIVLNGDSIITLEKGKPYVELGATATDDLDGNITNKITISGMVDTAVVGTNIISYTVKDLAGNMDSIVRVVKVIIIDKIKPILTILGKNPDTLQRTTSYVDAGATAFDNIDGNITAKITKTSNLDSSKIGTYTITYSAIDAAGNKDSAVRTIVVIAKLNVSEINKIAHSIKVYPSPAYAELNVSIENINQLPAQLTIVDMLGRDVLKQTITTKNFNEQININHLNNGVYFISISNANAIQTIKFMVSGK